MGCFKVPYGAILFQKGFTQTPYNLLSGFLEALPVYLQRALCFV